MSQKISNGLKKVVLITGGSEGLGKEIARSLLKENQVVILSTDKEKLESSAKELGCNFLICDVTKNEQVEEAVAEVVKNYGRLDVLVNNAGIWIQGELVENDVDRIKKVLEVNTLGTILFSKAVIPQMKKQNFGQIVNIVSQAGLRPKEERSVYNASKYALTGFTDSLNMEIGKYNIGVSGIYPYKMKTAMFNKAGNNKDMSDAIEPADVAKAVEFVLSYDLPIMIPHLEIKNNSYKNKV